MADRIPASKTSADSKKLYGLMVSSQRNSSLQFARAVIEEYQDNNLVLSKVLNPALIRVGRAWGKRELTLSQSFVCAKIAEDILTECTASTEQGSNEDMVAVIGNIEDDYHSLGRKIVANYLKASGWTIHDLGNDVPAEDFVDSAQETGASVIGVSAMMQTTALNISKVRELLDERKLSSSIKLAVGGAVFAWKPELADTVGADGTAEHAGLANDLFIQLNAAAKETTR